MAIVYIYLAFALEQNDSHTIYITIDDDDMPLYQLYFKYDIECSNFQRVIHDFSLEMEQNNLPIKKQVELVYRFIETNPLCYQYQFAISNKRQ